MKPTPTPTPVANSPVATPTTLSFTSVGNNFTQNVIVTETGYAGVFTAVTSAGGVATVAAGNPAGTFVVTPVGPGSATITFKDSSGRSAATTVSVTTTGIIISTQPRR